MDEDAPCRGKRARLGYGKAIIPDALSAPVGKNRESISKAIVPFSPVSDTS